jgi:cation-transporting ATPase 13A1
VSISRSCSGEARSVPEDMLLLAGSAIVNDVIITGVYSVVEGFPQ